MKRITLMLTIMIMVPFVAGAQVGAAYRQEPNVLSIFSDNGDYFYVILNGIKQNINPQSSIRIEGIVQSVNELQILFADNRTREIQKNITITNPVDRSRPVNLTLNIAREQDGDVKLHFYRSVPREYNYQPAQGEYVMIYGQDVDKPLRYYNDGQYKDGDKDRDHDRDHHDGGVVITPVAPPIPQGPTAMDNPTFASAKQTIAGNSFDDTKLSTAKMIANTNYFTTDQVIELCGLFSFEDSKLTFAKYAFKKTVDNNNYFKVDDVFSFDASKTALNDYVSKNR